MLNWDIHSGNTPRYIASFQDLEDAQDFAVQYSRQHKLHVILSRSTNNAAVVATYVRGKVQA